MHVYMRLYVRACVVRVCACVYVLYGRCAHAPTFVRGCVVGH